MADSQYSVQGAVKSTPARVMPTVRAAVPGLHSLPLPAPEIAGLQPQLLSFLWPRSVWALPHTLLC